MSMPRPAAALLTWPKRFECSAFWGMMKLLEIDGKTAPGEKPLDKSAEGESEEPAAPKHNVDEVRDMAKQKSFRLRESIVLQAKRNMMAEQRNELVRSDLEFALEAFIPSAQGLEKELQEMCAVLECTDRSFLTEKWRKVLQEQNGRAKLQKEVAALRELFDR